MSIRKRNEFLEGDESDGASEDGYDSEAVEESKGTTSGRARKRQRLSDASEDESDGSLNSTDARNHGSTKPMPAALPKDEEAVTEEEDFKAGISTSKPLKALKQVAAAQKAARRSGVVYISRVPPFMKPQTLKHFLAPHAPKGLGRIFLTPEDHVAHSRRVKSGGNKKKSFTDGWVEFVSKRDAKMAAETLNGNIIGGKKGNFYHDDLWSMKYLKGFKWSHLTEQIANENAERQARMREEVRKTKKDNKAFVEDIERGKMLDGMESKRKVKQARGGGEGVDVRPIRRGAPKEFKQKSVRKSDDGGKLSEQTKSIQSLIF
jgi:ESF2/ABP1 family protein